ncbi:MAG: hypothetical protein K2X87_27085, partial [Gemmataceae bacterium]|nr:hypothetical protein [Gemmataceae bacterium]
GMPGPGGMGMPGPGGMGMPGPGGMGGPGGMMGGRPGMPGPGGMGGYGGMGMGYGGGYGMGMGGFDQSAQRTDQVIQYIPLEDVDKAIAEGKQPAMTVIPLRMIVVNATFPFREQLEEVRRALRLKDLAQAEQVVRSYGFNGFNVRRRVILPNGVIEGTEERLEDVLKDPEKKDKVGFAPYDYEGRYNELIESRKLGDRFEGAAAGADELAAYLPYFYRYEDSLVMPLPELVEELSSYPPIKLDPIIQTVKKMRDANVRRQTPSDLAERLRGQGLKKGENGSRRGQFLPQTGQQTGAGDFFGGAGGMAGAMKPGTVGKGPAAPPKKGPGAGEGKADNPQPVSVDHLLVRFIDCEVRPGHSYQYQIQVELVNPNFGHPDTMANPAQATEKKYQFLKGDWIPLDRVTSVPEESYLYAYDPAQYKQDVLARYKDLPNLRERLQVKDNQAVVQAMAWLEQVKTDTSGRREPVGAWVVAEMPVGRGDYVGKRTFVKLPLWSSEQNQYVLRELGAEKAKGREQPKGWLVDFSTRSVLVDFDGGRVRTKANGKTYDEEVTTDLLIARPDGGLLVRDAAVDDKDPTRQKIEKEWSEWVKRVEQNRPAAGVAGGNNPFDRPNRPGLPGGGAGQPGGGD